MAHLGIFIFVMDKKLLNRTLNKIKIKYKEKFSHQI